MKVVTTLMHNVREISTTMAFEVERDENDFLGQHTTNSALPIFHINSISCFEFHSAAPPPPCMFYPGWICFNPAGQTHRLLTWATCW